MSSNRIYVDCDAMPRPLKDVLVKVAARARIEVCFVAAHAPRIEGGSGFIRCVAAGGAFNGADDWIAEHAEAEDLVITADIPLADRALKKHAEVLGAKGEYFTQANISNAMAMRELLDELRAAGEITGGPAPFSDRQRIEFTDALNRWVQKHMQKDKVK